MERENRYLVLKVADVEKYLNNGQQWQLCDFADQIAMGRELDGKRKDKRFVCVADDWPMYETVWKMIETWVDGGAPPSMDCYVADSDPLPTHRCKICGAFWRLWLDIDAPTSGLKFGDTWSLRSAECGECCDNMAMGDQIRPATIADLKEFKAPNREVTSDEM